METLFGTTSNYVIAEVPMTPVCFSCSLLCGCALLGLMSTTCTQSDVTSMVDHGFISEAAQSAAVNLHTTALPTVHLCLETLPCQWASEGNSETCGAQVTCGSVPAHFRNMHRIKNLQARVPIRCLWKECSKQIKRKCFVRHIHECHLGHPREKRDRLENASH